MLKRKDRIAAGAVVLCAATAWGLMISIVASRPALEHIRLPNSGFEDEHGRRETVVSARYGDGPGEIGISFDGEARGPQSFGVDDRDRVYILDSVNRRVVRFAQDRQDAEIQLPDSDFDDLVIARDVVCVLSRAENRRVIVFNTSDGTTSTIAVADEVPPVSRLFVVGADVLVECPNASGRAYHAVGRLDGTTLPAGRQAQPRQRTTPLPNGDSLVLSKESDNDVALEVSDPAGIGRARLRVHSERHVAAILDATTDRFGNIFVTWALTDDDSENLASRPKGRLVVTRHRESGELTGRIETDHYYYVEPFRKTLVAESGDLYQLATDRDGVRVVRWTPTP